MNWILNFTRAFRVSRIFYNTENRTVWEKTMLRTPDTVTCSHAAAMSFANSHENTSYCALRLSLYRSTLCRRSARKESTILVISWGVASPWTCKSAVRSRLYTEHAGSIATISVIIVALPSSSRSRELSASRVSGITSSFTLEESGLPTLSTKQWLIARISSALEASASDLLPPNCVSGHVVTKSVYVGFINTDTE